MKKKIFSIFFVLVLVLSFSLVTAVPVAAGTAEQEAAVIAAADRLVTLQNGDGGFPWKISSPPPSTSSNILGITSIGVLKAYELEDKEAYENSLAKSYMYAVNTAPGWIEEAGEWKESPAGVNSFPDVTFLVWLAEAAATDDSLLAAINAQVSGTTATDIAALAKARWDDIVDHLGATHPSVEGTATAMAEYLRDFRHNVQNLDAIIPWDLEAGVKAALALDAFYPGEGYDAQAVEIVNVLFACVDDTLDVGGACLYFDSTDSVSQGEYIIGLTGAIEASAETGLHTVKAAELEAILLLLQEEDGSWLYYGPDFDAASGAAQSTAYAIMALFAQGDVAARAAAFSAADWLVDTQNFGWHPQGGASEEITEVDSECAWAIKMVLDISDSVGMTAAYTPQIGIAVTPSAVNFGAVVPGIASNPQVVTVMNMGNVDVRITASIINESPTGVYTGTPGLEIDSFPVASWLSAIVSIGGAEQCSLILTVPVTTEPGSYSATLVFWAEMQ